ncbi:MAG: putative metal-binding motif-containing protein, partial [Myxococcota bacterium]
MLAIPFLAACADDLGPDPLLDVDNDGDLVAASVDCDDSDPAVYPGATEVCGDGVDNDCNGVVDDVGIGAITWYADTDRDGFGTEDNQRLACAGAVDETWTPEPGDCDDADPKAYPGALEICDGFDQDCDGTPDNDLPTMQWWVDADGDGFGDADSTSESLCAVREGWVTNGDDCNDADDAVKPGVPDVCDGIDNDCSSGIDDAAVASVGTTLYPDVDDAFLDASTQGLPVAVCEGQHVIDSGAAVAFATVVVQGQGV